MVVLGKVSVRHEKYLEKFFKIENFLLKKLIEIESLNKACRSQN